MALMTRYQYEHQGISNLVTGYREQWAYTNVLPQFIPLHPSFLFSISHPPLPRAHAHDPPLQI